MNVNSVESNLVTKYNDFQQQAVQTKKGETSVNKEVSGVQEQKQQNVQSSFGYEALNKSLENDPIAQFISYLV